MQKLNTYVFVYFNNMYAHKRTNVSALYYICTYTQIQYIESIERYKIIVVMERSWFFIGNNKSYFFCELDSQQRKTKKTNYNQITK